MADTNQKRNNLIKRMRGGYAVILSKGVYSDRVLFTALRSLASEYDAYVDEYDANWVVWVATNHIEDALNVAETIFKIGMKNGELGR